MEKTITDENFQENINVPGKLAVVDFFATWCEPCSMLGPILEKVCGLFKEKIVLIKANVDQVPIAAQKFGVEKIPTVVLFKEGRPINGFVGLIPENSIKSWLENIIKDNK
jgi:thioredoxin